MAERFNFELVSPERLLVSRAVDAVVVPAAEGEMTAMAGHAPVMASVRPGVVTARTGGEADERYVVFGGLVEVLPGSCTVLAERAVAVGDIDGQAIAQRIQDAREDLADAADDGEKASIAERLDNLLTLQNAL